MSKTLRQIAEELRDANKKVQLIYAFNGTGKTRLSREFKKLFPPENIDEEEEADNSEIEMLYYNAYTEDLFYWDNDLENDQDRKLKIQPNGFTNLVLDFLRQQELENNIATNFQYYTSDKITPIFNENYSEVRFSITRGNDEIIPNIKISKGEESNFVWCVFYSLLEQIVEILNILELDNRPTQQFNSLKYVFIDDPVSSLDDTHLIELAVNIATLIKSDQSDLKFIITTHNPLFYNVLHNEFNNSESSSGYKRKHSIKKRLERLDDGTFLFEEQKDDSPFSYHLYLLKELETIETNNIQKYHFNFLRNILEKMSTFLGYQKWKDLLPGNSEDGSTEAYYNRIINLSSHSSHHGEEISIIEENDKRVLKYLVREIKTLYKFK